MKKLLIIYPHWIPSNLVGVQRARLIANYLYDFQWQPLILTVNPKFYEEPLSYELEKTVSSKIKVFYVEAKPIRIKNRLIGDITLRAFGNLRKEALNIIQNEKVDFIWIPIPSFYTALLGRILYEKTRVPYGIDYIDPWVNGFAGQEKFLSKAWISNQLAKVIEPWSVRKASLITGVSELYFKPVLERNFRSKKVEYAAFPYGFDPNDYKIKLDNLQYPWADIKDCKTLIYAGAFLPKSEFFIESLFKCVAGLKENQEWDDQIHFFFIGTGHYSGKTIFNYACDYGLESIVHEEHERFSYLQILNFLSNAYGIIVIGSTEKHYTPSKIFQSILSRRPVFTILNAESTAVEILRRSDSDHFLVLYNENEDQPKFMIRLNKTFVSFIRGSDRWNPNFESLELYTAKASVALLINKVECIIGK